MQGSAHAKHISLQFQPTFTRWARRKYCGTKDLATQVPLHFGLIVSKTMESKNIYIWIYFTLCADWLKDVFFQQPQ